MIYGSRPLGQRNNITSTFLTRILPQRTHNILKIIQLVSHQVQALHPITMSEICLVSDAFPALIVSRQNPKVVPGILRCKNSGIAYLFGLKSSYELCQFYELTVT